MKRQLFIIAAAGVGLSSCAKIHESMQALEDNRQAIDISTQVIYENAQAIEEANRSIAENRRQLEEINKALKKASES
jgi:predicted ribosome quality control (RQC) complex YloA/Tae2 family protein